MTRTIDLKAPRPGAWPWLALALILAAAPAVADPSRWKPGPAGRGDIDVRVLGGRGGELRQIPVRGHRGAERAYLEAYPGEAYSIEVVNRSPRRVGVVVAVDGRNIISGGRSELSPDERMYILEPYGRGVYEGWRTSRDRVNRFYFTDAEDSYAEAWGDGSAMGVIAVAAFREARDYRRDDDIDVYSRRRSAPPGASARRSEPGTGFGQEERSPSRQVHFEPERRAFAETLLKYEWRETLCERRIIDDCHRRDRYDRHDGGNRFWPDRDEGFAPYPPGRR